MDNDCDGSNEIGADVEASPFKEGGDAEYLAGDEHWSSSSDEDNDC